MVKKKQSKSEGMGYYKIRDIGNGLSISLPKAFANYENLTADMYVKISWRNHVLTVEPVRGAGDDKSTA